MTPKPPQKPREAPSGSSFSADCPFATGKRVSPASEHPDSDGHPPQRADPALRPAERERPPRA